MPRTKKGERRTIPPVATVLGAALFGRRHRGGRRHHRNIGAVLQPAAELDSAFYQREDRVVLADADVAAGMILRAALPDDDVARNDGLAAELLHAEAATGGIAAIARTAACFLVRHAICSPAASGRDVGDAQDRHVLTMAALAPIVLPALLLEDDDLEIGRASCRERVWQSVYISVVAVSLKKKQN